MKVELKSIKTGRIILIGNIIKCNTKTIKLDSSPKLYNRSKVIVQYVISCLLVVIQLQCVSCKSLKTNDEKEINNQIINSLNELEIQSIEEIELREN